jgi:hypothetical protein
MEQSATCPFHEQDESSPCLSIPHLPRSVLILFSHLHLCLKFSLSFRHCIFIFRSHYIFFTFAVSHLNNCSHIRIFCLLNFNMPVSLMDSLSDVCLFNDTLCTCNAAERYRSDIRPQDIGTISWLKFVSVWLWVGVSLTYLKYHLVLNVNIYDSVWFISPHLCYVLLIF